ncbi:hypothetical protein Tco_1431938 [Tanacetum coccineum]
MYCSMVSTIASASSYSEYSWSKSRLKSGDLNSSRLRVLKCLLDDRNSRSGSLKCMTRNSTNELFTPYKEPEREFRSSSRHFKTLSLDELRSPNFNLLSDQEYSEEEEVEAMAETMEQYMSQTRTDYGTGFARPKIKEKDSFELKG